MPRLSASGCANKYRAKVLWLITGLCWGGVAKSHTPDIGQIIRFQPNALRGEKPKAVTGQLSFSNVKIPFSFHWNAPADYKVTLNKIPSSFSAIASTAAPSWMLQRKGKRCILQSGNLTVSCPPPEVWAAAELSGSGEEVAGTLVDRGFAVADEVAYRETDARSTLKTPKQKNTRLGMGTNGTKPIAIIEIRGPSYRSETPGTDHPVLQYEQTFLKLMLARYLREGDLYTVKGTADLTFHDKKTRYQGILAKRVEVWVGSSLRLTIDREKVLEDQKAQSSTLPKTLSDIRAFEESLSPDGLAFLHAFLMTH